MFNEPVIFGRFLVNSTQGREYLRFTKKFLPTAISTSVLNALILPWDNIFWIF